MGRVCRIVIGVAIALSQVSFAHGQAATATIRGLVRDSQGRPVPSATVTVVSRGTALSRVVPTAEDGSFVVANLPPLVVDLTVTASGFGDATHGNIVLEVGQAVTIDISLAVAGVRERVDVEASTTGVDTTRSVVDAVIPSSAIEALPLNGRNFLELAFLVPGNAPAPNFDPTKSNSVVVSSAGQIGRGGNIMIDGADNNDDVVGGPLQNVTQEAVQEFQIATNRFTAEFGRSASSMINVVTKSGTEQLRGSAALFLRDSSWQGLPATFDRSSGDELPFDRQQIRGLGRRADRRGRGRSGSARRSTATRTAPCSWASRDVADADDHAPLRAGAARRLPVHGPRRLASDRPRRLRAPLRRRAAPTDTSASTPRPRDRLGLAAAAAARTATTRSSARGRASSSATLLNALSVSSFSTFDNAIAPVDARAAAHVPEHPGRHRRSACRRARRRSACSSPTALSLVAGLAHGASSAASVQRVDALFDLGVFRDGRHRDGRGLRGRSTTTATAASTTTICCSR